METTLIVNYVLKTMNTECSSDLQNIHREHAL